MGDKYKNALKTVDSVVESAAPITPHDTDPLPDISRGLYVGTGGDIVLRLVGDDTEVTFRNVANGTVLPLRVAHVHATGTTATDLVALL